MALACTGCGKKDKSTDDYVGHLSNYDQLKANDLAENNDIQKIAFLIL